MPKRPNFFENLLPDCPVRTMMSTRHSDFDSNTPPFDGTLIRMRQTHSTHHVWVESPHSTSYLDTDALISSRPGDIITVNFADCLPILIYHPSGVVACIHAGRRGTLGGITHKVLTRLRQETGTLDGIVLYFGPSIGVEHYEVGLQLNFNMVAANQRQVWQLAPNADIRLSPYCTYSDNDIFYSYRHGDITGRNCCFIQLL